jgi:hypothetical protein
MKPGDCYIDEYYEPEETVMMQIIHEHLYSGCYKAKVIYTSDPDRVPKDSLETVWSNDKHLVPAAMITIDNKVMIIKL